MSPQFWPSPPRRAYSTGQTTIAGYLSASWADVPGLSLSPTLEGGPYLVIASIQMLATNSTRKADFRLVVDGTAVTSGNGVHAAEGWYEMGSLLYLVTLAAGAHTIKVQSFGSGAGVVTLNYSSLVLIPV